MIAIETKYLGPTEQRGSRIKAVARGGWERNPKFELTIGYPYEFTGEAAHAQAAIALAKRLGWTGKLIPGAITNGYVFVFESESSRYEVPEHDMVVKS